MTSFTAFLNVDKYHSLRVFTQNSHYRNILYSPLKVNNELLNTKAVLIFVSTDKEYLNKHDKENQS